MQIDISTRHGELPQDTLDFIKTKVDKLNHIFARLTMIEVVVDMKENQRLVEIKAEAEHKHDFVATAHNEQIPSAVEAAVHKIEAQLRKYKEKIQSHRGDGLAKGMLARPIPEIETESDRQTDSGS